LSERPADARLELADVERRERLEVERLADERLDEERLALDRVDAARLGLAPERLRLVEPDFFDPPELDATCSPRCWMGLPGDYLT
jgi:hypothetical protein